MIAPQRAPWYRSVFGRFVEATWPPKGLLFQTVTHRASLLTSAYLYKVLQEKASSRNPIQYLVNLRVQENGQHKKFHGHDWVVKGKVQGVRRVQGKRKTWSYQLTKATGDSKHQLGIIHAYKWLLLRSSRLFSLNRDYDMLPFCRLKLFVCDEDFPT